MCVCVYSLYNANNHFTFLNKGQIADLILEKDGFNIGKIGIIIEIINFYLHI